MIATKRLYGVTVGGEYLAELTAGLAWLDPAKPSSGALREARQRLGSAPLRALLHLLRGPAVTTAQHTVRWRGLLATAIDGTIMSVGCDVVAGTARVAADREVAEVRWCGRAALADLVPHPFAALVQERLNAHLR